MADTGSVTADFSEFDQRVDAAPGAVRHKLMAVAGRAASSLVSRIRANAAARGWKNTPNEVVTEHVASSQFFRVSVQPRSPRPANLPIWLEYGTRKMAPRPFVMPAVRAVERAYEADCEQAVQDGLDETVNR